MCRDFSWEQRKACTLKEVVVQLLLFLIVTAYISDLETGLFYTRFSVLYSKSGVGGESCLEASKSKMHSGQTVLE